MRKFLIFLTFLFGILLGGVYFASGYFLEKATLLGFDYLIQHGDRFGVEVANPKFKSVNLHGVGVRWKGIHMLGRLKRQDHGYSDWVFSLGLGQLTVKLNDFATREFYFEIKDIGIRVNRKPKSRRASDQIREDQMVGEHMRLLWSFDFMNPATALSELQQLVRELTGLLTDGRTKIPVEFSGKSSFTFDGKPETAAVRIVRVGNESVLVMDETDLKRISKRMDEALTPAEIQLIARYPLRVPKLLRIRDKARSTAEWAHIQDPSVPEDAYRHVLWSYLLTQEWGPDFAKLVTDSHEVGDIDDTPADHRMDYNNNSVGRRYALKGYAESSILGRLMRDPNVIRQA